MAQSKRGLKASETYERILVAAEEVFAYYGYNNANLSDIAARVGIKAGSMFYHYPGGKQEIYRKVVQQVIEKLGRSFYGQLGQNLGHREQIGKLVGGFFDFCAAHPLYAKMLFREVLDNEPGVEIAMKKYLMPMVREAIGFLREGQKRGVLRPLDPFNYIFSTCAMILSYFAARPIIAPLWGREPFEQAALKIRRNEVMTYALRAILVEDGV